jgi:hypothetical protein
VKLLCGKQFPRCHIAKGRELSMVELVFMAHLASEILQKMIKILLYEY